MASDSEPRDFVGIAKAYAKKAADERNRKRYGKWIRLAAKRFLNDLKRARAKGAPFKFDAWHANDPCDFIEKLPHVEGKWKNAAGEVQTTITLHESDVFFIVNLFGFRLPDGNRRFSSALKAIARKNAKSTIAAGIGLYCQVCEGEEGPQVISAATTYDQAAIIFKVAKRMVEKTTDLRDAFQMEPFAKAIASYSNGGTFKALHAKASTQDGLNPSTVLLDEIHAHKTHDLINVLRSAAGARENVLYLYTTTEGYETPGPWPELRQFAKQVLEGVIEADHFLVVYYALDDADEDAGTKADDDFDESTWIKANPLMDVNPILLKEIRKEAIEAKQMPGKLAEFQIKRLNRSAATAGGLINLRKWKLCGAAFDLADLKGFPCWGGLDLASTTDLTSFRLVWPVEGLWFTHGWRWVPTNAVKQRSERGLVPFPAWVQAGHLIQAGDEVTDYDAVEAVVLKAYEDFDLRGIGYDGWNAKQLSQKLIAAGVPMQQFIQGPKSYSPAIQELERAYLAGKLRHGGDPVLTWCASNLIVRTDQNMNRAPDKKRAAEKIDDMSALLMGIGTALGDGSPSIDAFLNDPISA